jgi:hypothetical protein
VSPYCAYPSRRHRGTASRLDQGVPPPATPAPMLTGLGRKAAEDEMRRRCAIVVTARER